MPLFGVADLPDLLRQFPEEVRVCISIRHVRTLVARDCHAQFLVDPGFGELRQEGVPETVRPHTGVISNGIDQTVDPLRKGSGGPSRYQRLLRITPEKTTNDLS